MYLRESKLKLNNIYFMRKLLEKKRVNMMKSRNKKFRKSTKKIIQSLRGSKMMIRICKKLLNYHLKDNVPREDRT